MAQNKPSLSYRAKKKVAETSLLALATTFELASRLVPELQDELKEWEDGFNFSLGVLPEEPAITMRHENGRFRYLGKGYINPDLKIMFKNVDSLLLPFTGQIGAHTAFIQRRAILHGNVSMGIKITRAMLIVQTYLMPGLILKKTFKNPPKLSAKQLAVKSLVMGALTAGLIKNSRK